jgi:hypothetical protein
MLLGLSVASALLVSGMSMSALRSAVPRQQADETTFVVGVTSWNGSIEVLGRFDGMRWINTWPEVDEPSRPVPRLADMPTAWLGNPATVSTSDVMVRQFRGEEDPGSALRAHAVFRLGARAIWLMSAPGYEWISFKFIEVTSTSAREVLTTQGAGC